MEKTAANLSTLLGSDWIEHPRHAGYWFSRDGRASSWRYKNPRILVGCECGIGYRAVSVPLEGRYTRVYIHRAVCELFNGGYGIGMHCRHLDTNLTNNSASNLAWGTPLQNAADSREHGKTPVGTRNPQAKLTPGVVAGMRQLRADKGLPFKAIAELVGVTTMTAHRAVTGVSWK